MECKLKKASGILNTFKSIDSWFWCRYSMNPYNGCGFGCIYCDSRSERYHLPENFSREVSVKENAAELLDRKLSSSRKLRIDPICMSGTTDPYQRAEAIHIITRSMLKVLLKHRFPLHLVTKSTLVKRDKDILAQLGSDSWCSVSFTITSPNVEITRIIEPNAPSPKARFKTMEIIKKQGNIQTGINLMPIIPFLTDRKDDLERLVDQAVDHGADYILFAGLSLRDRQKKHFMKELFPHYPDICAKLMGIYRDNSFPHNDPRYRRTEEFLLELCDKKNINWRMKRFIPEDFRKYNYIISEMLFNRMYEYQVLGKPHHALSKIAEEINELPVSITSIPAISLQYANDILARRIENYLQELKAA